MPHQQAGRRNLGDIINISGIIILAGGRSLRLGEDKILADLAGQSALDYLLHRLLRALPQAPVIAVGKPRPSRCHPRWVREDPPEGGPVAGLAAGLAALPGSPAPSDQWFMLLAGDLPFAALAVPALLRATPQGNTALVAIDETHRRQPLLACYQRAAVAQILAATHVNGMAMHELLQKLRVGPVSVPPQSCWDIDTPEDLERARRVIEESRTTS